jgi:hypothetical protein
LVLGLGWLGAFGLSFLWYKKNKARSRVGLENVLAVMPKFLLPKLEHEELIRFYERIALLVSLMFLLCGLLLAIASVASLLSFTV